MAHPAKGERYKFHRVPAEMICHGVWLYSRFTLSDRAVQDLLCERGITVAHEAVRPWCRQCGQDAAKRRRRRRPQPGDTGHLAEVLRTSNGERHDLWRAVDQDANVLDLLGQRRRNTQAAKTFCCTLLKGLRDVPRVIMTDKRKSDGAAKRDILPGVEPRQSRSLTNRCEHSHRPTRQRDYRRQGFTSAGQAQRLPSAYGPMAHHCRPRRPLLSASAYRQEMRNRFERWAEITGSKRAA